MSAPDPYRAVSILADQIWRDLQVAGRRILVLQVDPERVHYVSTYSSLPGRAGFAEVLERIRTRGAPASMKRSRFKSCFRFESGPTAQEAP